MNKSLEIAIEAIRAEAAEVVRAKCEAIAREEAQKCDWIYADTGLSIADAIAALKDAPDD